MLSLSSSGRERNTRNDDPYLNPIARMSLCHNGSLKNIFIMPRSTNNSFSQPSATDRSDANSTRDRNITQQMQQEADQYTRMYQWERRNLVTLETVFVKQIEEIQNTKKAISRMEKDCEEGQTKKSVIKAKNLLKDIDIYDNKHNQTVGEIERLKKAIELLRQEKSLYKNNLRSMETEIARASDQTERLYQDIELGQNNSKTSQNVILDLKLRNDEDKTNYYKRIGELNRSLREPRNTSKSTLRAEKLALPVETSQILRQRLTKLILNNKDKIKLIDSYQKNMKVIDEAFNTIREATGITDIQEIQNTFIKGEEQNYGLLTYVDVLNQQIDNLVDNNSQLKQRIELLEKENADRERILHDPTDQNKKVAHLKEIINKKKEQTDVFQKVINEIQPSFQDLMVRLAKSKFNTKYPLSANQYETGGVNLNESTLDAFLSEMEEYTNQLLYFKGKVSDEPNSEIFAKTLMIDEIPVKDFRRRVVELAVTGPPAAEDPELNRELLDNRKLKELAQREIEKQKSLSVQERPKKK